MFRIQSSPKRTWSYPVYRIQPTIRGMPVRCPVPQNLSIWRHPAFQVALRKKKRDSSDGALLTSPHPFLTEATKVKVTRYEKGLPFTARKISCLFHCATLDPLKPKQKPAYPLSFRSAAPQPHRGLYLYIIKEHTHQKESKESQSTRIPGNSLGEGQPYRIERLYSSSVK